MPPSRFHIFRVSLAASLDAAWDLGEGGAPFSLPSTLSFRDADMGRDADIDTLGTSREFSLDLRGPGARRSIVLFAEISYIATDLLVLVFFAVFG